MIALERQTSKGTSTGYPWKGDLHRLAYLLPVALLIGTIKCNPICPTLTEKNDL